MKTTAKYNGYTNYETWNVVLWFRNDEDLNKYWLEKSNDMQKIKALVENKCQFATGAYNPEKRFDIGRDDLEKVNWSEVYKQMQEDRI